MKKRTSMRMSHSNVGLKEYMSLGILILIELFVISTSLLVRDSILVQIQGSIINAQKSISLEGSVQQLFPNTESTFVLKANPNQPNSTVATVRMNFQDATVVGFRPESGFFAVGVCEGGKKYTDNQLCVDLGNTNGNIIPNQKMGEVMLRIGGEPKFDVVTAQGNGFYNGQDLSLNVNTTMAFSGSSILPMTGEESTSLSFSNYPLFLGISGFIILVGAGGLVYLVIRKDPKNSKTKVARIVTVSGILIIVGGTLMITNFIINNNQSPSTINASSSQSSNTPTITPTPAYTAAPTFTQDVYTAIAPGSIACGTSGCTHDADCAGYIDNKQEGSATCDQVTGNDPAKQICKKLCQYGYENGNVCKCATGASQTPAPSPTGSTVVCSAMDYNSDKILNYVDMFYFMKVYNKTCSNDPSTSWSCGGQDSNNDKKVDSIDNSALIANYYPKVSDCTGMTGH